MKIRFLFLFILLFSYHSYAQIWELASPKFIDMKTQSVMGGDAQITIDSNQIVISMGGQNFYYEITEQALEGGSFVYRALDRNDYTTLITFNTSQKTLDCVNQDGSVRYVLDKIEKPVPPLSPEEQAKQDSIKKALADSLGVDELEDTTVYTTAEIPAEFPGGKPEMMSYLSKNVRYPKEAKNNNIHGFVTVTAIVEKDGTLSHVTATKDIGGGCGQEAVRVVKSMPAWSPAENKGENVRMSVTILVGFMK